MKKQFFTAALVAAAAFGAQHAVAEGSLSVKLAGLTPEGNLPLSTAFCLPPGMGKPGDESPGIRWSAGPAGTKSYVIISTDPDVVRNLSLMNKPGVTIPADAPRMNIYHWVLIDIPAIQHHIPPGGDGAHFVPGGKPIGQAAYGVRGTNDYWPYFNKRPGAPAAMKGPYGGFDGPCAPKNDLLVHDYKFQVFALDVAKLPLSGQFFAPAVFKAMQGHVLAQGEADAKFTFSGK